VIESHIAKDNGPKPELLAGGVNGFSLAETENLAERFLLGRALGVDHLEPF